MVEKVIADIEGRVQELQQRPGAATFERSTPLSCMVTDSIELDRMLASYPPSPRPACSPPHRGGRCA
jgi:hypothetical protein